MLSAIDRPIRGEASENCAPTVTAYPAKSRFIQGHLMAIVNLGNTNDTPGGGQLNPNWGVLSRVRDDSAVSVHVCGQVRGGETLSSHNSVELSSLFHVLQRPPVVRDLLRKRVIAASHHDRRATTLPVWASEAGTQLILETPLCHTKSASDIR